MAADSVESPKDGHTHANLNLIIHKLKQREREKVISYIAFANLNE